MAFLTDVYSLLGQVAGTPGVGATLQKKTMIAPEQPEQVSSAVPPQVSAGPTISGREKYLQDHGIFPQLGGRWGAYRTGLDGTIPRNTLIHPFNAGLI